MQLPTKVEEFAPAKVNLTLHVTGRRADGYHLLDSLVVFVDVGDTVSVSHAPEQALEVTGPFATDVPEGSDNLVLKAAALIPDSGRVHIGLHKSLPAAAGIGGGSADAAACLRALSRLCGQGLPSLEDTLALGADVPVCVISKPTRMQGIGEALSPASIPAFWCVLLNPRVEVPTGMAFQSLDGAFGAPMAQELPQFRSLDDLVGWLSAQRNDLEPAALGIAPPIGECLSVLRAQRDCLLARMSGSGATCFGLFASAKAAQEASDAISAEKKGWWVAAARSTHSA